MAMSMLQAATQMKSYDMMPATGDFLGNFMTASVSTQRSPAGMVLGPDGNVYVASSNTNEILRYDATTGDFLGVLITDSVGGLDYPIGLDIGIDSNLYVVSNGNDKILKYSMNGNFEGVFVSGPELYSPTAISFDERFLYVSSDKTNEILRYDATTGDFLDKFITDDIGGLDSPTGCNLWP